VVRLHRLFVAERELPWRRWPAAQGLAGSSFEAIGALSYAKLGLVQLGDQKTMKEKKRWSGPARDTRGPDQRAPVISRAIAAERADRVDAATVGAKPISRLAL
jgi:hypothetical protein